MNDDKKLNDLVKGADAVVSLLPVRELSQSEDSSYVHPLLN
tara:strand:+ start:99 stop:221 length:123 start_codon:yes stop_codon:yes gene_type:complete